jgi:hypothetical protein
VSRPEAAVLSAVGIAQLLLLEACRHGHQQPLVTARCNAHDEVEGFGIRAHQHSSFVLTCAFRMIRAARAGLVMASFSNVAMPPLALSIPGAASAFRAIAVLTYSGWTVITPTGWCATGAAPR